jgi:hypothetical protein
LPVGQQKIRTTLFRKNKYIWPLKNKLVKIKKYISRQLIVRLCLLLALMSAAAIFDLYHVSNPKMAAHQPKGSSSDEADNKVFFFNQSPSTNFKTLANDFVVRIRFACTQDKFLLKYYNLRTFQMMKAETSHSFFTSASLLHSLPFKRVIYESPDDTPPLS